MQPAFAFGRDQPFGALQIHDVDVIVADVRFELRGKLRPLGIGDGNEVLDPHRVQHLSAEPFGGDADADALARGIDGRSRTRRTAADDQHVERVLGIQLFGRLGFGTAVEPGDDLF